MEHNHKAKQMKNKLYLSITGIEEHYVIDSDFQDEIDNFLGMAIRMDDIILIAFEQDWDNQVQNIHSTEILISQNLRALRSFADSYLNDVAHLDSSTSVFIQGYKNYEDAHAVALAMRENNPLCYENTHMLN